MKICQNMRYVKFCPLLPMVCFSFPLSSAHIVFDFVRNYLSLIISASDTFSHTFNFSWSDTVEFCAISFWLTSRKVLISSYSDKFHLLISVTRKVWISPTRQKALMTLNKCQFQTVTSPRCRIQWTSIFFDFFDGIFLQVSTFETESPCQKWRFQVMKSMSKCCSRLH